jgi:16S rRNA (uracil1498-N3)-methyltransferase
VPVIDERDRHHVERVLRVAAGERVTVSDGAGAWRACVVHSGLRLEPVEPTVREARPTPELTVGFAITKGERPEWTVQKLTECGIDRIVPFVSARGIVRWDVAKAARNVDRLRRVAREASMQSRRRWLPNVVDVVPFEVAVGLVRPVGAALADVDPDGRPPLDAHGRWPSLERPAILVGPEGGWTDDERACGLPLVGLGPGVFRSETAAVAAGVLLAALRNGIVSETSTSR